MAALDYLRRAGLTVEAVDDKLRASPAERITPEVRQYITSNKAALLAELTAAMPPQPRTWLRLLALADGRVIQRTSDLDTATIEEVAQLQYGDDLIAAVAVPGFERLLTETEIVKALAGTLAAPDPTPPPSSVWLARVARLLGRHIAELLEGGHLEPHDLIELAGTDAVQVAVTIRNSPAWINRPQRIEQPVKANFEEEDDIPQRTVLSAATASQAWREVDAAHTNHLMSCRACSASTNRYCAAGAELRQRYDNTPIEANE